MTSNILSFGDSASFLMVVITLHLVYISKSSIWINQWTFSHQGRSTAIGSGRYLLDLYFNPPLPHLVCSFWRCSFISHAPQQPISCYYWRFCKSCLLEYCCRCLTELWPSKTPLSDCYLRRDEIIQYLL